MTDRRPRRHLPMVWHHVRVTDQESFTFRWGRGSGEITVHRGDVRGEHRDDTVLSRIPVGTDWIEANDLRNRARTWLRARARERKDSGRTQP